MQPCSRKFRVEKVAIFIDRPWLTSALTNSHTEQASLSPWLLLHVALHVQTVLTVFLPPQIITKKAVWPCKIIPHWPRCWPILITCYLVVHHHWINPRNILWEIHLSFHFWMCIYLPFLWCCRIRVQLCFLHFCKFLC